MGVGKLLMTSATSEGCKNNKQNKGNLFMDNEKYFVRLESKIDALDKKMDSYIQRTILIEEKMSRRPSQVCEKVIWDISEKAIERNNEHLRAKHKEIHEGWKEKADTKRKSDTSYVATLLRILSSSIPLLGFLYLFIEKIIGS